MPDLPTDAATDEIADWIRRLNVSDAVRRYFLAFDMFDWERLSTLVADEVTLRAPGLEGETLPRDEFIDSARRRNGGYRLTVHMNPDHVVDLDGDTAKVTSHLLVGHGVGDGPGEHFWGYGFFELDLIVERGRWVVSSCTVDRRWADGGDPLTVRALAAARFAG
jgi:hypothetical protein